MSHQTSRKIPAGSSAGIRFRRERREPVQGASPGLPCEPRCYSGRTDARRKAQAMVIPWASLATPQMPPGITTLRDRAPAAVGGVAARSCIFNTLRSLRLAHGGRHRGRGHAESRARLLGSGRAVHGADGPGGSGYRLSFRLALYADLLAHRPQAGRIRCTSRDLVPTRADGDEARHPHVRNTDDHAQAPASNAQSFQGALRQSDRCFRDRPRQDVAAGAPMDGFTAFPDAPIGLPERGLTWAFLVGM